MQIEEGKYYRTEANQIVGPMSNWDYGGLGVDHPWQSGPSVKFEFEEGGDLWRTDGTSDYCPTLIGEVVLL